MLIIYIFTVTKFCYFVIFKFRWNKFSCFNLNDIETWQKELQVIHDIQKVHTKILCFTEFTQLQRYIINNKGIALITCNKFG